MLEKLSMAHRRRGDLRVSCPLGVIMLAHKLSVCDVEPARFEKEKDRETREGNRYDDIGASHVRKIIDGSPPARQPARKQSARRNHVGTQTLSV